MDKISKVIEKRSSVRSSVTKIVKRCQSLDDSSEDFDSLSELLEMLKTKEEILKKYDLEIEDLITDPEKFKVELKGSEDYDDRIISAKIKLRNKINMLNPSVQRPHSSHNTSSVSENSATALKLPKLEMSRFSGDSSNFMEFFNCFNSAIGSNDSLTKIEKFQYLKSLLSGPAYNVVAGFELNEKNYDSCIELLKQRYGRNDYIINSYMTKLLNLEPVKNSSYVKGLRRLYDEIEVNIRNLRALNVTEGSYGHLLNPLLLKLLPQDLVLDFHRKRNRDANCEVSEILTFLRNEVESREICESVISSPKGFETKQSSPDTRKMFAQGNENNKCYGRNTNYRVPDKFPQNQIQRGKNYYATLKSQDHIQGNYKSIKCYNCGESSHKSVHCPRRNDGPVCFRCAAPGHKSDVCPMKDAKTVRSNSPSSNKIMKSIKVMGKTADALIDSGSEVCMASYNFYVAIGCPKLTKNSVTLSGISGSTVIPLGFFNTDILIDDFVIKMDFYVLEDLNNTIILGHNFLSKLNFVLNEQGFSITGMRQNCDSENKIAVNYAYINRGSQQTTKEKNCLRNAMSNVTAPMEEKYDIRKKVRLSNSDSQNISLAADSYGKNTQDCKAKETLVVDEKKSVYLAETANSITLEEIDVTHVTDNNNRNDVIQIVQNYLPIKTKTTNLKLTLNLTDELPIAQRPRRLAYIEQQFVEDQIQEWLRDGIIRESNSNFASPIVLAKKKCGKFRLCIDYRKINKKIIRDHYPLPLIEEVLDKIEQAQVFTSLDLKNGFFHVDVDEASKKYTSFVTHNGQFEFNKVPFGLSVSPQIFQRYICAVFRELIKDGTLLVYMDDVIIPAQSEEEGLIKLKRVLKVATEYGLEFNFAKCQFLKRKIEFLGYIIENGTIRPSETKTLAVQKFPEPTNVKQLQSFLGLTGYFRKYIEGYAKIARPLSDLLKAENKFNFGPLQKEAFHTLKERLANQPVLHIFKRGSKLELHTDASSHGFGAVLLQQAEDGTLHPIHYMSRKTTPTQSKYSSYELEALAVVEALKKFRNYLLGNKIKIVTDCSAFQKTLEKRDLAPKVARWALFLQEFDYEIIHRSGKQMQHVDSLSRNSVMLVTRSYDELTAKIKLAQQGDEHIQALKKLIEKNESKEYFIKHDIVYKYENDRELLMIPNSMQTELIRSIHIQGHYAVAKTESIIKENYYIPQLRKNIETVIANCIECILCNRKRGKGEGLLNPIPKQDIPLHTYHVDHIGPLPSTNKNYNHILTVVDGFTKFVWLYPVKSTSTKEVIDKLKLQNITFGNPVRIISDKGTAFTSNDFQTYCQDENIEHITITTGIPRGNGQVERIHESLIPILSKLSIDDSTKWYKYVAAVQRTINSTISRSTKYSPFELLTGVKLRHATDIRIKEILDEEYVNTIMTEREQIRNLAKENIFKVQEENRKTYNKQRKKANTYKLGDLVAIQKTQFGTGLKLRPKFLGPYQVTKVKRNDRYDVQKVGCHEGPNLTSSAADFMKRWTVI